MNHGRKAYLSILIVGFMYSIVRSYMNVLEEHTTVEETKRAYNASFPSFTFCVADGHYDLTTIAEVDKEIRKFFEEKVSAFLLFYGLGVHAKKFDLKNETVLTLDLSTSFDHVWELSSAMAPVGSFPMNPCFTLNVPLIDPPTQGYHYIGLQVTNDSRRLYYVKHEYKQSQHHFEMDRSISFQLLLPNRGSEEYLIQTETTSLKTSRYDCIQDNSMQRKACIDEFINEELRCRLPWIHTHDQVGLQKCQSEDDLKSYRNLSYRMTSPFLKQKLVSKGCFRPNCKQTTWTKNQLTNYWDTKDGSSFVAFIIPSTSKVIQRKEIRLADFATFIADCGSYLGLFLGASVLSLTDIVITYIKRIFKAICERIGILQSTTGLE